VIVTKYPWALVRTVAEQHPRVYGALVKSGLLVGGKLVLIEGVTNKGGKPYLVLSTGREVSVMSGTLASAQVVPSMAFEAVFEECRLIVQKGQSGAEGKGRRNGKAQPEKSGAVKKAEPRNSSGTAPASKPGPDAISISEEYLQVQALLEAGSRIVFVSGNAGTGKSTLIRHLRRTLDREIVVLAPTGVAALNVGGTTVHSFFRFSPKIQDPKDIEAPDDCTLYEEVDLLIIDEVSMLRCDLVDAMDALLRKARSNPSLFGGVQVLLLGDLFQLPPVLPKAEAEVLAARGYVSRYFFSALCLQDVPLSFVELTLVHRQTDPRFVGLLNRVRLAERKGGPVEELNRWCDENPHTGCVVTLCATNAVADRINEEELGRISSTEHVLEGEVAGKFKSSGDRLPSPRSLRLKVDAHVMITRNDEQKRWVNGTMGIVRGIGKGKVRVEVDGATHSVERASWETYQYEFDAKQNRIISAPSGKYTQYPLMLAWAVTIHKSQGKTLGNVLVDLGNGAFDFGQVYVALSR
jgi:ATP-dependent DNA helicase PIF1